MKVPVGSMLRHLAYFRAGGGGGVRSRVRQSRAAANPSMPSWNTTDVSRQVTTGGRALECNRILPAHVHPTRTGSSFAFSEAQGTLPHHTVMPHSAPRPTTSARPDIWEAAQRTPYRGF